MSNEKTFEARMLEAGLFKKILDAIKDMVKEGNFHCKPNGMMFQGMDSAHVALVSLLLNKHGFDMYRCERNRVLGLNIESLSKIFKSAQNSDIFTMHWEDESDVASFLFEDAGQTKHSVYNLKLLDIDEEMLGIPDTKYSCIVRMPSAEFKKICTNLSNIGDTLKISVKKEGIRFHVQGLMGDGETLLHSSSSGDDDSDVQIQMVEEVCSITHPTNTHTHTCSLLILKIGF
jgi:proliferating cell nuclear antigen